MREHALVYLAANLPDPPTSRSIASHARQPLKRAESELQQLQQRGALQFDPAANAWASPPLRYTHDAYTANEQFLLRLPAAAKEELERRLVKALSYSLGILVGCLMLAIVARIPFPLVFFGGLLVAFLTFLKILKAPPPAIPEF